VTIPVESPPRYEIGARPPPPDQEEAREIVYGMAYEAWKAKYQTEAQAKPRQRAG